MTPNKTLCFATFAFKHVLHCTKLFKTGCEMFKKEAVTKHEKKDRYWYTFSIKYYWNANSRAVIQSNIILVKLFLNKTISGDNCHAKAFQSSASSAAREAAISKSKAAIISALRNVYFAAI